MVKLDIPLRVRASSSSSSSQTRVGFFPVPVRQSVAPRARLDRFDRLMIDCTDGFGSIALAVSRAVSSSSVSSHDSHESRVTSRRFTHTRTQGGFGSDRMQRKKPKRPPRITRGGREIDRRSVIDRRRTKRESRLDLDFIRGVYEWIFPRAMVRALAWFRSFWIG
jgi:hypothetical protein